MKNKNHKKLKSVDQILKSAIKRTLLPGRIALDGNGLLLSGAQFMRARANKLQVLKQERALLNAQRSRVARELDIINARVMGVDVRRIQPLVLNEQRTLQAQYRLLTLNIRLIVQVLRSI